MPSVKHYCWALLILTAVLCGCRSNQDQSEALYRFWEGGNVGYMDATGEVVIPARFHHGRDFHDGQAVVVVDAREWAGQWAVIDTKGNYLIEPSNDRPIWFHDNRWIMNRGGVHRFGGSTVWPGDEWILTDRHGNQAGPTHTFNRLYFSDPCIIFEEPYPEDGALEPKWGFLDFDGKVVIGPKFDSFFTFENGVAVVDVDGMSGIIDAEGKWVIEPTLKSIGDQTGGEYFVAHKDERVGVINLEGNWVLPPKFDQLGAWSPDGRAFARQGQTIGVIDRNGQWLHRHKRTPHAMFSIGDDFAREVRPIDPDDSFEGHRERLMSRDGKWTAFEIEQVGFRFTDGLRPIVRDSQIGYINKDLDIVIPCRFQHPDPEDVNPEDPWQFRIEFRDGIAPAMMDDRWGYIDHKGDWLVEPIFKEAYHFRGELALVIDEESVGYINRSGDYIWRVSLEETKSKDPDRQYRP